MSDNHTYRKLVIDPRALRPKSEVNSRKIYRDAIRAIDNAKNFLNDDNNGCTEHVQSDINVLDALRLEVSRNRWNE